jgi:hypothetical protein
MKPDRLPVTLDEALQTAKEYQCCWDRPLAPADVPILRETQIILEDNGVSPARSLAARIVCEKLAGK